MKRALPVLAAVVLAALAMLAYRACERPADAEASGAAARTAIAEGKPPGSAAGASSLPPPLSRAETAEPASAAGASGLVRLRFRDWHSGEDIAAAAVVELTPEGAARVAEPTPDGEYRFEAGAPIVLVANFARHVPLLAVARDAPPGELTPIHAYAAAYATIEFADCDASRLLPDSKIQLRLEPSNFSLPRSEHGQFLSVQHRFLPWAHGVGEPDLSLPPTEWFPPARAKAWREGAERHVRERAVGPPSPVAAIALGSAGGDFAVDGAPVHLGSFPAHYSVEWLTALPLVQVEPAQDPGRVASVNEAGVRSGSFAAPPGETLALLVWSAGASIRGRVPGEGLPGGAVPPIVRLSGIVRGEHSPPNGSYANSRPLSVDPASGEFRADDLAPGEYQVDVAWSVGVEVKLSAVRVTLGPGDARQLGPLSVPPGPSLRLELLCQDLAGNALLPADLFREPGRMRGTIGVIDRNDDPLGASVFLDLPIAFGSGVNVHGLRPGFVWAHAATHEAIPEAELLEGVRFLRFAPQGDRVTLPEEDQVSAVARFAVGAIPVTLRFAFPDEARGWKFSVHLVEARTDQPIQQFSVDAERDPRRRRDEASLQLTPGEYVLFAHVTGWKSQDRSETRHFAFQSFAIERPDQIVDVELRVGITARGVAEPGMGSTGWIQFEVESIHGVREPSRAVLRAQIAPDGGFVLEGLPPGAILHHRTSKSFWTADPNGILVRM